MARYEFEELKDFCAVLSRKELEDVAIRQVVQKADGVERPNFERKEMERGVQLSGFFILTAATDKDYFIFSELGAQEAVFTEEEAKKFMEKLKARHFEIVSEIQKKCPKISIFSGLITTEQPNEKEAKEWKKK